MNAPHISDATYCRIASLTVHAHIVLGSNQHGRVIAERTRGGARIVWEHANGFRVLRSFSI